MNAFNDVMNASRKCLYAKQSAKKRQMVTALRQFPHESSEYKGFTPHNQM